MASFMYCTHTAVLGLYGQLYVLYIVQRDVAVLGYGLGFGINNHICIPAYGYVCALSPQY